MNKDKSMLPALLLIAGGLFVVYLVTGGIKQIAGGVKAVGTFLSDRVKKLFLLFGSSPAEVYPNLTTISFLGHNVLVNKKVAQNFINVDSEVKKSGIKYNFDVVQTYNWRVVTGYEGTNEISSHGFGIATDINPDRNPYRKDNKLITDIPSGIVAIFKKNNFAWGGDYKNIKDPMHFEVVV